MEIGDALKVSDIEDIAKRINYRRKAFPLESFEISVGVVLMAYGEQYRMVYCGTCDWSGEKKDVPNPSRAGVPHCPYGHVLFEDLKRPKLGWIEGE